MTKAQRIRSFLTGLFTMACSLIMAIAPDLGFEVTVLILCLTLIFMGLRYIIYYHRMARHMVGGKSVLFLGVVVLDMGLASLTLHDVPMAYIMLYLIVAYAFSGVIDILRAVEARGLEARSWKLNFTTGIINVCLALLALISGVFLHSVEIVTIIYCAGLFYSGLMRIISAFRRGAIVYIA